VAPPPLGCPDIGLLVGATIRVDWCPI
jgi:hypothetical protein